VWAADGAPVNPELSKTLSVKVKYEYCTDNTISELDHEDIPGLHYVRCHIRLKYEGMPFVQLFSFFWRNSPQKARDSSLTRFLDHT